MADKKTEGKTESKVDEPKVQEKPEVKKKAPESDSKAKGDFISLLKKALDGKKLTPGQIAVSNFLIDNDDTDAMKRAVRHYQKAKDSILENVSILWKVSAYFSQEDINIFRKYRKQKNL